MNDLMFLYGILYLQHLLDGKTLPFAGKVKLKKPLHEFGLLEYYQRSETNTETKEPSQVKLSYSIVRRKNHHR